MNSKERLMARITAMALFIAPNVLAFDWTARQMTITSVARHAVGTVQSVDLSFGPDNGSSNKLYVAWGGVRRRNPY